MSVIPTTPVEQDFAAAVRSALLNLREGDVEVLDASVRMIEDATNSPAWRVTLFLTRPGGDGWDVDTTRVLKRAAREKTDEMASALDNALEGLTSVVITTREAPDSEVALDDEPAADELAGQGTS